MGDTTPGAPGVNGADWATEGFTEITPADPSANLGDADCLIGSKRNQTDPKRYPVIEEAERGDIEPLKSKWVP